MKKIIPLAAVVIALCCFDSIQPRTASDSPTDIGIDTTQRIDQYLAQLASEKNFSGGLLIIKNKKKVFSKGYGWANKEKSIQFTPSTFTSMGSITKAFTAAGIMKLVEQGKLSVSDPLKKFFPNAPNDKAGITVHQLLTHSSGFHEFLKDDGGDYEKVEANEFLKRAFTEPLAFKPGEKAVYTNVGMSVLGIILEQVSGMDYEVYLKKNLFGPAGIYGIGYHIQDYKNDSIAHGYRNGSDWGTIPQHIEAGGNGPYWNLKANGGLEVSLNDMALWINAISNHIILKESTVQLMFTPHIAEDGYGGRSSFGYGCNIQTSRRNTKVVDNGGSNGIYFARMLRDDQAGVVFYLVTNESTMNANMVMPNITQLYFQGSITQDMTVPRFGSPVEEKIYNTVTSGKSVDLSKELAAQNITVDDDMVLLEVGQRLIEERNNEAALSLYSYYTKTFPNIVVAWNDLGDVYLMKSNKEEAIKCYKQALTLRPGNPRAKANLEKLGVK